MNSKTWILVLVCAGLTLVAACGTNQSNAQAPEVNPTLDVRNTTAEFATELALSALGKNIL